MRLCGWTQCLNFHINFAVGAKSKSKLVIAGDQGRKKKNSNKGRMTEGRSGAMDALHKSKAAKRAAAAPAAED